jgi:DNA-binding winged helix-turn-helix (wHTH) protein/Tfp pilus assembly protein PilF
MCIYEFGPFNLDADQLLLSVAGNPIALGPKVVETLLALVEHPGEVLSKAALLDRVWPEGYVEEANLAQNVYVLRKALRTFWNADAIATIPRRGYRFLQPVSRAEHQLSEPAINELAPTPIARSNRWRRPAAIAAAAAIVLSIALAGVATTARNRSAVDDTPQLSAAGARLYAIGRYYWNQRSAAGVEKSLTYFSQVVAADPHDARGYAAVADADAMMGDYRYGPLSPDVYLSRARSFAQKALTLDRNCAEAFAVLGIIEIDSHGVMSRGLADIRHAIALDPSYGPAHEWYGIALLSQGDAHGAMTELQTAADLDPLSVATTASLSSAAYYSHRYVDAIAYARQALDMAPQRTDLLMNLGAAYEARGQYARAIAAYQAYGVNCATCAPEVSALLAHVYALQNRLPAARAALASAQAHPRDVAADDVAAALTAIGEPSKAVSWLQRLRGHYGHALLALDPRLNSLHGDAQFQSISKGIGASAT